MTIHGAKGLEFDIVVLPNLDKGLVGRPPKIVVAKDSPAAPVNFVLRWVSQELHPLLPKTYKDAFTQWKDEQVKESLAVLYVAMTRARYELVMLVRETAKPQSTYAGVLREGLKSENTGGANILFQSGNADWDEEVQTEMIERQPLRWYPLAKEHCRRNLPRITPSSMELEFAGKHGEPRGSLSKDEAALRGTAIHACFAEVEWLENFKRDESVLRNVAARAGAGERTKLDTEKAVHDFLAMCEQPAIKKVLERANYPAEETVDVARERRFAVHFQEKILRGTMDRLVIRRVGNTITAVEIIDFKTDGKPVGQGADEFLSERKEIYRPQMEAYKQAAAKMFPSAESITAKLVFTSVNDVVVV